MLNSKQKKFYADIAWGASELSKCDFKQGCLLARGGFILAYGYNKKIVESKEYEISAIYNAAFNARESSLNGATIFSTYFPSIDDMKIIISCGISTVYFFGVINDPHAVEIANRTVQENIPLELIQLK